MIGAREVSLRTAYGSTSRVLLVESTTRSTLTAFIWLGGSALALSEPLPNCHRYPRPVRWTDAKAPILKR